MNHERIANNVKRLRLAAGYTQAQLAERAGISRVTMRQAENVDGKTSEQTIKMVAQALGVSIEKLQEEGTALKGVRFRALKKMRSKEHVIAECANMLSVYARLEDRSEFPKNDAWEQLLHFAKNTQGEGRAVKLAREVRKVCGLGAEAPIPSITDLLEYGLGIRVISMVFQTEGFFGLCINDATWGAPAVVVNVWDRISVERWIFTAAHELGHLLMHRVGEDRADATSSDEEDPQEEKEANEFASELLMPMTAFEELYEVYKKPEYSKMWFSDKVLNIKRIFGVSYKTVLYRWQTLEPHKNVWMDFATDIKWRLGRTLSMSDELFGKDPDAFDPEIYRADELEHMAPGLLLFPQLRGRAERMIVLALIEDRLTVEEASQIIGWSKDRLEAAKASATSSV